MKEHHIVVTIGGVEHALTRNQAMGLIERLQNQLDATWREWIEDMLDPKKSRVSNQRVETEE